MRSPDPSESVANTEGPAPLDPQLTRSALRGGAVMGVAQAVKVATQFLSVVLLSRLLNPEDFGLVAAVAPIGAFVALFQDLGLQQAIIQRPKIAQEELSDIFWITVVLGLVCSLMLLALSPGVAWFYGDERLRTITLAASVPLFIACLGTSPMGLLNRHLRFGTLALLDIAASLLSLGVTLLAAWAGAGYWALMLTPIAYSGVSNFGAWIATRWWPDRPRLRKLDREITAFGANITGFGLMNYLARNLDNILIGRHGGPVQLGYYDRAYKLLLFPLQNINMPLSRVMVPLLSRMQEDKARMREVYLGAVGYLTLLVVPGMAAAACVSGEMVELLFGAEWKPVAPIFAWLGLASLVQPLNNSTGWLFIAQGRTRTMFRWGVYSAFNTILSFVIGMHWGAVGVAASYALSDYFTRTPMLLWLMGRVGPVRLGDLLRIQLPLLASSALCWVVVQYVLRAHFGGFRLIVAAIAVSYLLAALAASGNALGRGVLGGIWAHGGALAARLGRRAA